MNIHAKSNNKGGAIRAGYSVCREMEIFTILGIWERGCIKPKPVLLLSETGFAFLEIDKTNGSTPILPPQTLHPNNYKRMYACMCMCMYVYVYARVCVFIYV